MTILHRRKRREQKLAEHALRYFVAQLMHYDPTRRTFTSHSEHTLELVEWLIHESVEYATGEDPA